MSKPKSDMLKNYLKTAIRNLSRNKIYAGLNVIGLSLGIGCALVIFKVISHERSYDTHLTNYEHIYRVVNEHIRPDEIDRGMGTPHPVAPAIAEEFPEATEVVRTHYIEENQLTVTDRGEINKFLIEEGIVFTENSFFEIFDVDFKAGSPATALTKPNTALISESMSRKLYGLAPGAENKAVGKSFKLNNLTDFEVVGIVADPIETTNFPFTVYLEYYSQKEINIYFHEGKEWNSTSSNTNTYLLASETFDIAGFNNKLLGFVDRHYEEGESKRRKFIAQPLSDVHTNDDYDNYAHVTPVELINAIGIIAIFLVLTACINFINLATAQAAKRAKEIGIRKALGSYSGQLVTQFFSETIFITAISILCSLVVSELLFILLEDVVGFRLQLDLMTDYTTLGFLLLLLIIVSFLSGFYPSILLSRMNAVMALKSKITTKNNSGGLGLRKALVILQFAITQFLIIGTVIISAQMKFFLDKDLGFEKEAIIKAPLPERDELKQERFKNLMLENPSVDKVTFCLSSPTGNNNNNSNFNYAPLGAEEDYHASYKPVDEDYFDLFELELLAGRSIEKNDSLNYAVINRKTADLMGFKDNYAGAIGEKLSSGWIGQDLKIIGVMENFHSQNLSDGIQYVFLLRDADIYYELAFKTSEVGNVNLAITHFESVWEEVYPEYVLDWAFFDKELAENYEQEQRISVLMRTFSIISIAIGCLGLYGLIAFISANRTKEVGIRKVLGASIVNIIGKFTSEVFLLVIISFAIAAPLAYMVLSRWLNDYEFRIELGAGFFVIAFIATILIAALTIGHRTISTALMNPAKTLKDE